MTSATAPGTALAAFIDLKDSEDQDVEKERQRKFLLQIQRHTNYNQIPYQNIPFVNYKHCIEYHNSRPFLLASYFLRPDDAMPSSFLFIEAESWGFHMKYLAY